MDKGENTLISIIISSYNYEKYLRNAIDSALGQTYQNTEVIVVDDGSIDGSQEIIKSYGNKIIGLIKKNGGQASALNEGFKVSHGSSIIFMDSDDVLGIDTAEKISRAQSLGIAKIHWNLFIMDESGRTDGSKVRQNLSSGNLKDAVLKAGADAYSWPPTSGNAWTRSLLEKIMPIPESEFSTCPDLYLSTLAPLYGDIQLIEDIKGYWRIHPLNHSFSHSLDENLDGGVMRAESCIRALKVHALNMGIEVDEIMLKYNSRWHQMKIAAEKIKKFIPEGSHFIFVDEDHWKIPRDFFSRTVHHFLEKNGEYFGMPKDSENAIDELKRLATEHAEYIVFVWPYLWCLDYYKLFNDYLRENSTMLFEDDRIIIFKL